VRLYLSHFRLFVALSILRALAHLLCNDAQDAFIRHRHPDWPEQGVVLNASWGLNLYWSTISLTVAGLLVWYLVSAISLAAVTDGVRSLQSDQPVSIRGVLAAVRRRWRAYMGLQIATVLYAWGPFLGIFLLANVYADVVLASKAATDTDLLVWYSLTILAFLVAAPFGLWMHLRYALAVPASHLEGLGIRNSLQCSVRWTRGRRGRIFAVVLLIGGLRWLLSVLAGWALILIARAHPATTNMAVPAAFPLVSFLLDALLCPLYFLALAQLAVEADKA